MSTAALPRRAVMPTAAPPPPALPPSPNSTSTATPFAPSPVQQKKCRQCRTVQPITEFRRQRKGSNKLRTQCNACNRSDQRARYDKEKELAIRRFSNKARNQRDLETLALLVREMFKKFKGAEGFAESFYDAIEESTAAGRHRLAVNGRMAMINIIKVMEENQPDVSKYSDKELERTMDSHVRSFIKRHPHYAIEYLQDLGWEVTPPMRPAESPPNYGQQFTASNSSAPEPGNGSGSRSVCSP